MALLKHSPFTEHLLNDQGTFCYINASPLEDEYGEWLPISNKTLFTENLLTAVTDIHNRGVVHGDIHAGNILVNADCDVFLIDFENASCLDCPREEQMLPKNLVPEACNFYTGEVYEHWRPSITADWYDVGVILNAIWEGSVNKHITQFFLQDCPKECESIFEQQTSFTDKDIPTEIVQLINKLLAVDPELRL